MGLRYFGPMLFTRKISSALSAVQVPLIRTGSGSAEIPDGKSVVHVMGRAEQQSLWLRHIETGSDKEIVPANEVEYPV